MTARPGRVSRVVKVFVLTLFFLGLLLIFDPTGLSREVPSTYASGVRELAVLDSEPELIPASGTSQDFDGDGEVDVVGFDLASQESVLGDASYEAILFVDSGRTGERLLAVRAAQGSDARWFGDHDGNGTLDVVFELDGRWHVFGFVAE